MKLIILLAIITTVSSCGNQIKNDARFNPIRDQFVKDAKMFGVKADVSKVRIGFYDFHEKTKFLGFTIKEKDYGYADGSCSYLKRDLHNDVKKIISKTFAPNEYDYAVIRVNQDYKNQSAEYLEALVYHELGHCVLNKPHNESQAIMNTYGINSLRNLRYFYLKELFNNIPAETPQASAITAKIADTANYKLLYSADYFVFNEHIFHQIFYDEANKRYFTVDTPAEKI